MKKYAGLLFAVIFSLTAISANAGANRELNNDGGFSVENSGRVLYEIIAENEASVPGLERELEQRFEIYNRLFRFDPALLSAPLKVRVFETKAAYDGYITEHLGETKPGAVYLHYNQADRRELVIYRRNPLSPAEEGGADSPEAENSMAAHQAFIQYLRAFVPNPPSWLRDGFAIYYSTLRFDPSGNPDYEENLLWLERVKSLGDRLPSPESILLADVASYPEEFQISSWAMVSFLLNGGRDYFRDLTDSFMLLSPSSRAGENSLAVAKRISLWNDAETFGGDFRNYLDSRKTFKELMDEGHEAYTAGNMMGAELSFLSAMDQRPSDFAPYYYLGLLSYEENNYDAAEQYYLESRERGADEALINYALGINAAAAGRGKDAVDFLNRAAAADPAKYRDRVNGLLERIRDQ